MNRICFQHLAIDNTCVDVVNQRHINLKKTGFHFSNCFQAGITGSYIVDGQRHSKIRIVVHCILKQDQVVDHQLFLLSEMTLHAAKYLKG